MMIRAGLLLWTIGGTACAVGADDGSTEVELCSVNLDGKATWIDQGEDSFCETMAAQLSAKSEEPDKPADGASGCRPKNETSSRDANGSCRASAELACDPISGRLDCVIMPSGDASCTSELVFDVGDAKRSCDFKIEIRPN